MGRQTSPIRYRNKICHRQLDHKRVSPALPLALLCCLSLFPTLSLSFPLFLMCPAKHSQRRQETEAAWKETEREREGEWGYSLLPSLMF